MADSDDHAYIRSFYVMVSVIEYIKNTNVFDTGTVFVLPEPVSNETRDDFRGPEFRSRRISKQHRDSSDRRRGKR